MISNPKHGWCNFKIEDFEGTPSYLTDVPINILDAFIEWHRKGYSITFFDEEGSEFYLVLTLGDIFIIEDKEETTVHTISSKIEDVESEVINGIKSDLQGWSEFITDDDRKEILVHRDEIRRKIAELERLKK